MKMTFFIVGIVTERIFIDGSETGSVTFFLVKEELDLSPDPDPKLGRKWDPDPNKIVSDPQQFFFLFANHQYRYSTSVEDVIVSVFIF
jgi:hypothetical protein